mgnify:CR=1 FL=1
MNEGNQKRGRGRPGTYANAAERARAWRQKQRDLIASARAPIEPVIVEKIVEKLVERIIEKPAPAFSVRTKTKAKTTKAPDASALFPLLQERFKGFHGEENAKRFRVNAAKAATVARDVLQLFGNDDSSIPEVERAFLHQTAQFFDHLNGIFTNAQAGAKNAKIKAVKEYKAKHEEQIKAVMCALFGHSPDLSALKATGEALLAFNKVAGAWLSNRYGVDKGYLFLARDYELRSAVRLGDATKIARELAEVRIEIGDKGRRWTDRDESCYAAGWADFEEYRANAKTMEINNERD